MFGIPYCILLLDRVDGALLAILALALELDMTVNQSEQGIVAADTDIVAGMDVRASLTNQNVAREDELTVRALHAQSLGLGITTVLSRTAALLMCEELKTDFQHLLHLHNFDIIRIIIPQGQHGQNKTIQHILHCVLIVAGCGKGQGDSRLFFVHFRVCVVAEDIIDRAFGKLDGGGDGSANDVASRLCIAAVPRYGESVDSAVMIENFDCCHYTEIFSIRTLVYGCL